MNIELSEIEVFKIYTYFRYNLLGSGPEEAKIELQKLINTFLAAKN